MYECTSVRMNRYFRGSCTWITHMPISSYHPYPLTATLPHLCIAIPPSPLTTTTPSLLTSNSPSKVSMASSICWFRWSSLREQVELGVRMCVYMCVCVHLRAHARVCLYVYARIWLWTKYPTRCWFQFFSSDIYTCIHPNKKIIIFPLWERNHINIVISSRITYSAKHSLQLQPLLAQGLPRKIPDSRLRLRLGAVVLCEATRRPGVAIGLVNEWVI